MFHLTFYLRFGNFIRRVAIDKVRPDPDGEIYKEEGYSDHENKNDIDEDRFQKEETPVIEMAGDSELADQNKDLKKQMEHLENEVVISRSSKGVLTYP